MDQFKKGLKVLGSLMPLSQKQHVARPQVQAAEDGAPGVLAADRDRGRVAPARPTRPQGRQQQQVGFVLGQKHGARGRGPNLAADPAFFSLVAGRGSARNGSASTRNHAPTTGAGGWPPTKGARVGRPLAIAAATAPSSPCRRSPNPPAVGESANSNRASRAWSQRWGRPWPG